MSECEDLVEAWQRAWSCMSVALIITQTFAGRAMERESRFSNTGFLSCEIFC